MWERHIFSVCFRAVGTFARALDCSSSIRQPSLHMSAAAASRDITLVRPLTVYGCVHVHMCAHFSGVYLYNQLAPVIHIFLRLKFKSSLNSKYLPLFLLEKNSTFKLCLGFHHEGKDMYYGTKKCNKGKKKKKEVFDQFDVTVYGYCLKGKALTQQHRDDGCFICTPLETMRLMVIYVIQNELTFVTRTVSCFPPCLGFTFATSSTLWTRCRRTTMTWPKPCPL